jgi:tetratricopeptide (TPR) repeat protein
LISEAIPEGILFEGAADLGTPLSSKKNILVFNQAIATLLSYSLIRRSSVDKTIFIHHLVADIVRNNLTQEKFYFWSEKVFMLLKASFSQKETASRNKYDKLIPHITKYIDILWQNNGIQVSLFPELPFLLSDTASYLYSRARYSEAERLYLMIAYMWEQLLGEDNNPYLASTFIGLANIYKDLAKMDKAAIFYTKALAIWDKASDLPELERFKEDIAHTFNSLANFYRNAGEFDTAILYYDKALDILNTLPEIKSSNKVYPLVGLTTTLVFQYKLEEAEKIYLELLDVYEQAQDWDNPDFSHVLSGLATLYHQQNRIEKAEEFFLRAINNYRNAYGSEHIRVSLPLFGLARIYHQRGNYKKAEELFLQTLSIQEQLVESENEQLLFTLSLLSDTYRKEEKLDEAELFEKRYKDILRRTNNKEISKLENTE